ncbi:MAG: DNA topoisomerase III [Oscillospiraceae bacterium]|nr:DNA topoisomerase III [Oscillospiraceae bacterium]
MEKSLIIAEKPSVAIEFAKALKLNTTRRNGYLESETHVITWCVGHLVTMSYPEKYDEKYKYWRLETLPFLPKEFKYEIIPNVQNQFNIVKELLNREDVVKIYVCTDSGREGEYIYRLVDQMSGNVQKEKRRVWIDSQTEEEIRRGIEQSKDLKEYDSLADSAYLRAKEDYLIGINFSRLLSILFGKTVANKINEERASISVGRVMTCVLGMIVSREREIKNFVKTTYYKIVGEFEGSTGELFEAEWKVNEKSRMFESTKLYSETGFKSLEDAKNFINDISNENAVISEVKKSKQKDNAPLLYNLAELQNECTKKFKIKPDQTLEALQKLYEKKMVTYPRTDARVLSTAVAKEITKNLNGLAKNFPDEEIQGYIKKMIDEKYSTNIAKTKYVNDKKITDHYAIIPTGSGQENYEKLSDIEKNIYKLIVKRFLSIFYPPAEYQKVQVTVNIGEETFHTSGKVLVQEGYLYVVKSKEKEDKKEKEEPSLEILNSLRKGQNVSIKDLTTKEAETTPPARYNSGSIILAMENAGKLIEDAALREQIKGAGIGTSATRAEIMKKLERISYISINTKTQIITPTEKGEIIYDVVKQSVPDMLNPELTASWEKGLEMVAKKEIDADVFMEKLENYVKNKVNRLNF